MKTGCSLLAIPTRLRPGSDAEGSHAYDPLPRACHRACGGASDVGVARACRSVGSGAGAKCVVCWRRRPVHLLLLHHFARRRHGCGVRQMCHYVRRPQYWERTERVCAEVRSRSWRSRRLWKRRCWSYSRQPAWRLRGERPANRCPQRATELFPKSCASHHLPSRRPPWSMDRCQPTCFPRPLISTAVLGRCLSAA